MPEETTADLFPVPELFVPVPGDGAAPPADVRPVFVPEGEDEHFAFRSRDLGPCGRMTGDILVLMVFVSTPAHRWTPAKRKEAETMTASSIRFLKAQARRYDVNLSLSAAYFETSVPMEFTEIGKFNLWYSYLMKNYFHADSMAQLHRYYENRLHKSDTPVVFLFTNENRSFAVNASTKNAPWNEEFCMIFCDSDLQQLELAHELCHQYGAVDLYDYSGEGVAAAAKRIFPGSVMLRVHGSGVEVDDLTAYLLGWTDKLSLKAKLLLAATRGKR